MLNLSRTGAREALLVDRIRSADLYSLKVADGLS
jgi:hypothetical protein